MDHNQEQLDLKFFNKSDDEEDLLFKRKLYALVNGDVTPTDAALDFDICIVERANGRLEKFRKRPLAYQNDLTPEEINQGIPSLRAVGANPSGDIELSFQFIASLCAAFSPYRAGQNRIIQFMEALRDLPEHKVPNIISREAGDPIDDIELWPFGDDWLLAPGEIFHRQGDGAYSNYRHFFPHLPFACLTEMKTCHSHIPESRFPEVILKSVGVIGNLLSHVLLSQAYSTVVSSVH